MGNSVTVLEFPFVKRYRIRRRKPDGAFTRMFIIWSIFGLVERIMKKTTSLGSESIPNVKNKNFALESFFLMISCKILKRLKNLDLV